MLKPDGTRRNETQLRAHRNEIYQQKHNVGKFILDLGAQHSKANLRWQDLLEQVARNDHIEVRRWASIAGMTSYRLDYPRLYDTLKPCWLGVARVRCRGGASRGAS